MINWLKKNWLNMVIGCALGIPFGMYVVSQQQTPSIIVEPIEHYHIYVEEVATKEALTIVPTTVAEETVYFDVPLSHEIQDFIFAECEEKNIAPALVIAIIERESNYNSDAVGDKGKSLGLMQIQSRWHSERMEKLGVTDLMNPYENIKVGIDLIADLRETNSDVLYVLMAYNGGSYYADKHFKDGKISEYAIEVSERAAQLEERYF